VYPTNFYILCALTSTEHCMVNRSRWYNVLEQSVYKSKEQIHRNRIYGAIPTITCNNWFRSVLALHRPGENPMQMKHGKKNPNENWQQ